MKLSLSLAVLALSVGSADLALGRIRSVQTESLFVQRTPAGFELRGPDGSLLRQSSAEILDPRWIAVGSSDTRLAVWSEGGERSAARRFYRVALKGGAWSRLRETSYEIKMQRAEFDPLVDAPDFEDSPLSAAGKLFLVQYVTQPLEAFHRRIEGLGGRVRRFVAKHAEIVELSPAARVALESEPFVRWIGPYHPEYRLDPQLLSALSSGDLESRRYVIQVMQRGPTQKGIVAERIVELGGAIEAAIPQGFMLQATLSPRALAQVVTWNEVLFVDEWSEPRTYMDKVRVDGGADFLEANSGMTGAGVAGEALDTGIFAGHQDFQSNFPLIHGSNSNNRDHGTAVAGIVFGDGTGSGDARGMMPDGTNIFSSFLSLSNRYTHTAELLQPPYEAVFQTNSWGIGYGGYGNQTTELDDIALQNDIVIVQAQGNSGNQTSEGLSHAKNVVSVGGIIHNNTQTLTDDRHQGSGGSTGPAPDGRLKPDLSFWYDSIRTTAGSGGYTSGFGGTSAATPETAGHIGLFHQMWHMNVFGNDPQGMTAFESRPKPAFAKAWMINTAEQYPFTSASADLRRARQGWGRADLQSMFERSDRFFFSDHEVPLENLESASWQVTVPTGETAFKVTMVYPDVAGTTSSSQHRINDLSLRVTAPDSTQYWGNNGLTDGNWSTPGGSSNTLDTVENVFVENPTSGTWTVEVLADEVNQDAHDETPEVDAAFALVISGVEGDTCPDPANYCVAASNSVGPGAVMSWSGSQDVGDDDFTLLATGSVPNQFGIFFYGPSTQQLPLGNGFLCISGSLFRLRPTRADAGGAATYDLDFANLPVGGDISNGDTWNFQWWYRDPSVGARFNLSDGLEVTFCD